MPEPIKDAKPKRKLVQPLRVGTPKGDGDLAALRMVAQNEPEAFMRKVDSAIDAGALSLRGIRDIRAIYRAFADVEVPLIIDDMGVERAITTSAFPVLTGNIVVAAINDAYEQVPTIGEQLVTEMDSDKKVDVIARIENLDTDQDRVKEGDDFPLVGVSEDTVEIGHWRNGRRLAITKETVEENDVANIVARIDALGKLASEHVELLTLRRVIDVNGSAAAAAAPYVYRPNGTGAALYSATANTPGTRAPSGTRIESNELVDETDLDAVRTQLAAMRNERGLPIPLRMNEMVVLVPDAKLGVALQIKGSEYEPSTTGSLTVNNWGRNGAFAGWKPVSSPFVDLFGTTHWYAGWPKEQFMRKWKLRMEYVTLGQGTQAYLQSRTAFQARVAWDCEVGATDYVYFVQCLNATTPPSDI